MNDLSTATMSPTVSVIIPCYNGANTIEQAVDSVLRQTFSDLEVIVIDDGSTDDSVERLSSINDDRLMVLENEENEGIPATRNRGIRRAKGRFLCFLDQDDIWLSKKLEYQVELITTEPEIGVVYSPFYVIDDSGQPTAIRRNTPPPAGDLGKQNYLSEYTFPMTTKLFRKACIDAVGLLDESLYGADDHDLDVRILTETNFEYRYFEKPLAFKRQTGDNAGGSFKKMLEDELYLAEKYADEFDDRTVGGKKSKVHTQRALGYLHERQKAKAFRALQSALKHNPFNWRVAAIVPALVPSLLGRAWLRLLERVKRRRRDKRHFGPPPEQTANQK